jgi:PAS domain S-box-containing protein
MLDLAQKAASAVAFEWHIGAGEGENRWSPDLEVMYGLEPGSYDGTYEAWKKLVFPGDLPAVKAAIKRAHETGDVAAEYRVVHRDGAVRWLQARGRMFLDAEGNPSRMVGFMHDVTQRRHAEEALRLSEERYALAVASADEGIFDWDLRTDRVYVSQRAQELLGVPVGELWHPRRAWRQMLNFHPEDTKLQHDSIKALIAGETSTYDVEFRIILPDGSHRWFRQRAIALRDAAGKAHRMVGCIGDITDRKRAQEELQRLERRLRQAQRLEAMGTLAGGIAHDFNNILGAILGYGEMAMRDAPKGSRLARDLGSIIVAGERGRALVDRVLAFSRSGVGERVAVHVEKVVREALDLVSAKLPPNITLHARLRAGRSAILGDATQVHQVLMNLATNAVQGMPGGGTLRVSLDVSRIDASQVPAIGVLAAGSEYLVLRVADTGTGIAPDILERIFDPFFTTKEVGTGTGLGLSLVHGIVAELGGAIDVASTPGAGSTFTVYLPRGGETVEARQDEEPEMPRGDGQRVLIVDDEEPLVQLATRTLEELGYAPVGFTSSSAALAAFRADPQRFDALITDERMPGMSGSALIREVRGIRSSMPVVLMSGYLGAMAGKADEVLQKPLSARDLATSLARVLRL